MFPENNDTLQESLYASHTSILGHCLHDIAFEVAVID